MATTSLYLQVSNIRRNVISKADRATTLQSVSIEFRENHLMAGRRKLVAVSRSVSHRLKFSLGWLAKCAITSHGYGRWAYRATRSVTMSRSKSSLSQRETYKRRTLVIPSTGLFRGTVACRTSLDPLAYLFPQHRNSSPYWLIEPDLRPDSFHAQRARNCRTWNNN